MTLPIVERMKATIEERELADPDAPVLLMVSGGSDSTALAYLACELHETGAVGPLALLHVNHQLRGEDADADARFVSQLATLLDIPLFSYEIDVAGKADELHENIEAVARRERYLAANEALSNLCRRESMPLSDGRVFTAHTADDRVESFYMRSIVGTGPGGFRAMRYRNGPVVRPLMNVSREDLRGLIDERERQGEPVAIDELGNLWREDATNAHTDRFRAFVRHEIVPRAKERNPHLLDVLCRTMDLIADEDDMVEKQAESLAGECLQWIEQAENGDVGYESGCVLSPDLGTHPTPLARRVVVRALGRVLGSEARVETAAVDAILGAYRDGAPRGGYVVNIQGDLAVSANKRGVRIEPMAAFRARRKKD